MEIIIQPSINAASQLAARMVARMVREKPRMILGLATGVTTLPFYQELVRLHREEDLDFKAVSTFNLDEYVGLPPDHPASFRSFMYENFFCHVNIPARQIHLPDGMAGDFPAFCRKYENEIRGAGGLDIQLLGIGADGHIGFNEPSSSLGSRTRLKTLTAQTRRDNAHSFSSEAEVPHHVITMGVGTIMDAREVMMLAFGDKKAMAVAKAVEGPITAMVPASILQLHPDATVLLDEPAATQLARTESYRWVYDHKPDWQRP